jgi:hypothetical protein
MSCLSHPGTWVLVSPMVFGVVGYERSGAGHADAKIFYADDDDDTRYYQVGANEKDALARLNRLMIR